MVVAEVEKWRVDKIGISSSENFVAFSGWIAAPILLFALVNPVAFKAVFRLVF